MINLCRVCHKPFQDGDRVTFFAEGTYHLIRSKRAWAMGKDLIADQETLAHVECNNE